jgi:hypothetical protein
MVEIDRDTFIQEGDEEIVRQEYQKRCLKPIFPMVHRKKLKLKKRKQKGGDRT